MSQYTAPGRDGTYIDDPGRDNPTYDEKESLMMVNELENQEDEDSPFRPPPEEDEFPNGPYSDDPRKNSTKSKPDGNGNVIDADDDGSEGSDLLFEDDREAIEKGPDEEDTEAGMEDPSVFHNEGAEEDGRRQWKYSTANIKQRGIWVKWCCIALFFLICFAIFAAISVLFEKLFFDNGSMDPNKAYPDRPDNDTFPSHKVRIDDLCSSTNIQMDRGLRCREYCEPMHSSCCDAFPLEETYNHSNINDALNSTEAPSEFFPQSELGDEDEDEDLFNSQKCAFEDHLRGCSAYGKCSALQELLDPAPATLPQLCSEEGLAQDEQTCPAACRKVSCCYNEEGLSCLNENLDICMDYAPCQNLRKLTSSPEREIVPVAPDDIDRVCFWKLKLCHEYCENARCCTDPNSRCFQENFVACLTYAACAEDDTGVNITIPPMYSHVPQAPAELMYACGEREPETEEIAELVQTDSCPEYCEEAACCYQDNPADNCFHRDPLGCLAWHRYCQTEPVAVQNWFIGKYSPP